MSELSTIGKIMKALELAKVAQTGVEFTYFDAIELLGYLKSLEETIGLFEEELDALKDSLARIKMVAGNKMNDKADKAVIIGIVNDTLKERE